jgi:Tol biopolymer transport system component
MLRKTTLTLLMALLLIVTSAQAQESTEEVPPPTNTFVPSETPLPPTETLLPTDTPTETATLTLTPTETPTQAAEVTTEVTPEITTAPEVTAEVTEMPLATDVTATMTATLTETATATTTLFPETPLNLVYYEGFRGGEDPTRHLRPMGTLVRVGDNFALQVTRATTPTRVASYLLSEVALQTAVLLNAGIAQWSVRQNDSGAYTVVMDTAGQVMLLKNGQPMASASIAGFNPSQWHIVRLSATSSGIRVTVDGQEVIAVSDPAPLGAGFVSFGGDNLLVDDIQVWSGELATNLQVQSVSSFSVLSSTYNATPGELFTFVGQATIESVMVSGIIAYDVYENTPYLLIQPGVAAASFITAVGNPIWSPDHMQLAFNCATQASPYNLCVAVIDAATLTQPQTINLLPLATGSIAEVLGGWSPDGQYLLASVSDSSGDWQVAAKPLAAPESVITVVSEASFTYDTFLIDKHWGADGDVYISVGSPLGELDIYRIPFEEGIPGSPAQIGYQTIYPGYWSDVPITSVEGIEVNANGEMLVIMEELGVLFGERFIALYRNGDYQIASGPIDDQMRLRSEWSPLDNGEFGLREFSEVSIVYVSHADTPMSEFNPASIDIAPTTIGSDFDWTLRPSELTCSGVPAGVTLAFTFDNGSQTDIYVNQPGGTCLKLTDNGNNFDPAFSPDGTQIAYVTDRNGDPQVWVINADGLNDHFFIAGTHPVWSPDGTRIASVSGSIIQTAFSSDAVVERHFTTNAVFVSNLSWSPDGRWIAYDDGDEIWAVNAWCNTGCNPVNMTNTTSVGEIEPSWSPTGSEIAFADLDGDVYVAPVLNFPLNPTLDVNARQQLTFDSATEGHPTWSPNNQYVAFQRAGTPSLFQVERAIPSNVTPIVSGIGASTPDWLQAVDCYKGEKSSRLSDDGRGSNLRWEGVSSSSSPWLKKACLLEYRGPMFLVFYNETSSSSDRSLPEVGETYPDQIFTASNVPDHRYFYARVSTNGMIETVARGVELGKKFYPTSYFDNFKGAMSNLGEFGLLQPPEGWLERRGPWITDEVERVYKNASNPAYRNFLPFIYMAIHDSVYEGDPYPLFADLIRAKHLSKCNQFEDDPAVPGRRSCASNDPPFQVVPIALVPNGINAITQEVVLGYECHLRDQIVVEYVPNGDSVYIRLLRRDNNLLVWLTAVFQQTENPLGGGTIVWAGIGPEPRGPVPQSCVGIQSYLQG